MYSVLIVGAGYAGTSIGRFFTAQKQKVYGVVRTLESCERIKNEGMLPIQADLCSPETLEKIPPAHFIVLCAAPDDPGVTGYRKIYLEGIKHFLHSMKKRARPALLVAISSTSVWRERQGGWVDESVPADPDNEKSEILLSSENLILNSGYPAAILRCAGIYGPGRNRLKAFKSKTWPSEETHDAYMNLIHVEDIAKVMKLLFKSAEPGKIYTGVDSTPVLRSEFCAWLSERTGVSYNPPSGPALIQGKRLRNQSLLNLGYSFLYPSFREGYEAILNHS